MKEKWRTPEAAAVIAALICGCLTHLFGLVNTMHNYDDIVVQPFGFGSGIALGRWLLEILGRFLQHIGWFYNLTWLNGIVFILMLAIGAGMLCRGLLIQNRRLAALMGMLFVVFPTVVSSLVFRYTSILYGVGILLALEACLTVNRKWYGWLISAGLLTLSLGIYQAYLPLAIGVCVLALLRRSLTGEDPKKLALEGVKTCCAILLGVIAYYVLLKVFLWAFGASLRSYQGISTMGKISIREMPWLVAQAFLQCLRFVGENAWNLADSRLLRFTYWMLAVCDLLLLARLLVKGGKRTPLFWVLTVFLILVFPIAVNFIVVMCPDGSIYTLMQYGFVLVGCVPLVLLDCLNPAETKGWVTRGVCLFVGLLIAGYIYSDNLNYGANYYYTRQTENYLNSLMTQARMTEGFTPDKKWAFIGNIDDPMLWGSWSDAETDGGIAHPRDLVNAYSRLSWFNSYMGCRVEAEDAAVTEELAKSEEVRAMPCWPSQGSIRIIGDTVVIKCQNIG